VDTGAEDAFKEGGGDEAGVSIEVLSESGAGLLGMNEADMYTAFDEVREDGEKGDGSFPPDDVKVLDISGDDPEELLHLGDALMEDLVVEGVIEQELGHKSEERGECLFRRLLDGPGVHPLGL